MQMGTFWAQIFSVLFSGMLRKSHFLAADLTVCVCVYHNDELRIMITHDIIFLGYHTSQSIVDVALLSTCDYTPINLVCRILTLVASGPCPVSNKQHSVDDLVRRPPSYHIFCSVNFVVVLLSNTIWNLVHWHWPFIKTLLNSEMAKLRQWFDFIYDFGILFSRTT